MDKRQLHLALRCQHAMAKRDEAISDNIDRILRAAKDDGILARYCPFRDGATES